MELTFPLESRLSINKKGQLIKQTDIKTITGNIGQAFCEAMAAMYGTTVQAIVDTTHDKGEKVYV